MKEQREHKLADAMDFIGDDLIEEAESYKPESDKIEIQPVVTSVKPERRKHFEMFAGIATAVVIMVELGIGIKYLNDNITRNVTESQTSTPEITTTASDNDLTESTPDTVEGTNDIRADFAKHEGKSYGFDMALAKKYFYGEWVCERASAPYSTLSFKPNGNASFCSSVTTIYTIFQTDSFAFIYGSTPSANFVVGIDKDEPDTLYYMDMFYVDENGKLVSTNSEAVVPLHKFDRLSEMQNDASEPLNEYGLLEISDESGIPVEMISTIDYIDRDGIRWTRFDEGAFCPAYPIYLTQSAIGSYGFHTQVALYSETYEYERDVSIRNLDYTISKINGVWEFNIMATSQPFIDPRTTDDTAVIKDIVAAYAECVQNDVQEKNIADMKYFYAQWESPNGIKNNSITFAPYGECYGGSNCLTKYVFRYGDYIFAYRVSGGAGAFFTIDIKYPDVMYFFDDMGYDFVNHPADEALPEFSPMRYIKHSGVIYSNDEEISDFGIIELRYELDIDTSMIYRIDYTDENGKDWFNDFGYGMAPGYPIFLISQSTDSCTFKTYATTQEQIEQYLEMEKMNVREIIYTVSKSDGEWKQTVESVSDVFVYGERLTEVDNITGPLLRDMLKTYGECRENNNLFLDMSVAKEFFYAEWLVDEDIVVTIAPYGTSYGNSSSFLKRIFRMNDYAYIVMDVINEERLFVIDVKKPDVMYLLSCVTTDANGEITAEGKIDKYKRLNDIVTNPEWAITDFGIAELQAETGIDTGYIYYVEYIDENGTKWVRDVVSSMIQYINLISKSTDSCTFVTFARSGEESNVKLREITYTVSKSGDGWKQTIDSVGEPFIKSEITQ